ncbi:MAG: hypothetical protein FD129_1278, partial [bacterium]
MSAPEPEESMPPPKRILLVEDERAISDAVALNLREEGFEVTCADQGDE